MGFGDFLKGVGHGIETGLNATTSGLNVVDRYINPFHTEPGSASDADKAKYNSPLGNAVVNKTLNPSIENASRALNWVYNNGISQPISTALMAGELKGGPFNATNWAVAWHAANHISPGQALFLSDKQTQQAVASPLDYYKPASAYLPPGFDQMSTEDQQAFLKQAGMPVVGNRYLDELGQSNKMFKVASGTADFALHWWGDPAVLAGKGISKAKRSIQTIERPAAGWSTEDINKIMQKSIMGKTIDFLDRNKNNPQLLNNLAMAQRSPMGPRFGAIVSTLRNKEEISDFLRVGFGDQNAIEKLGMQNELARARILQDTERYSALDQMATRYDPNSHFGGLVRQHMDDLTSRMNADRDLVKSYNQVLDHQGELDKVSLSRWGFARAEQKTAAQAAYRARAARGAKAGALGRPVTVTPTPPIFSRGASTPVDLGIKKTMVFGIGDFFSAPVTIVRSFGAARPNGYMRIDDIDHVSTAELRGQLARIPGIDDTTRLNVLNQYLKTTTEGQRVDLLNMVGRLGAAKIAEKHGLKAQDGLDIYQEHLKRQVGEIDRMKRYSAAKMPVQLPDGSYARVQVDEFMDNGGKLSVEPNLVSKLTNGHVFQDLDELDRTLARHTSALSAIRTSRLGNPDWVSDASDYLTHLFKFSTLFRLGYIPRVLGDDIAGQWARAGSAAMAMRFGYGVKNGATNLALWANRPWEMAQAHAAQAGADFASDRMADIGGAIKDLRKEIFQRRTAARLNVTNTGRRYTAAKAKLDAMDPATTPPAKYAAMQALVAKHRVTLGNATRAMGTSVGDRTVRLRDLEQHHSWLDAQRTAAQAQADGHLAKVNAPRVKQGFQPVALGEGVYAPPALGTTQQGEYYQKLVSADEALGQIFETNKQIIHGHLTRSFDHGGKVISSAQDESLHAVSWARAINAQLVQDDLSRMAIQGADVQTMTHWLTRTPEGMNYFERLGLRAGDEEDVANKAWHEVDQYLPLPEIRQKALSSTGVTPGFLKKAVPQMQRPDVHTGQVGSVQNKARSELAKITDSWFKVASTIPANRMSRHPLFNQMYQGHLMKLKNQLIKQGAYDTTVNGIEQMATTARRLALRDTRNLVFDIAHRSDASAALRFIMPFMTATNESFQRWGRIIADKPQIIGYAHNFYNAPAAVGMMQDADGNHIDTNGYSYVMQYPQKADGTLDYTRGKAVKTLVPKSQRYIVGRVPKWVADGPIGVAFGMERSSGKFKLSQNSADLVTQGDPWFSPGFGPIVQVPVNELVKDKPNAAAIARHIDILPFGPQNSGTLFGNNVLGRAAGFFAPSTVKNFLTAYDTSDERYQNVKMQIMQRAIYEHENLGKPMPSAKKIAAMTKDYWLFSAASAFLQPMATQKADAYQFYRDQYNALLRQDPQTADDQFIQRYGESYFIFAQSQSQNATGVQATNKAVALEKKYANLIGKNPELGALIVGPEGNGPFSPEAYSYQLNTPVTPGGAEMQRTKMSADEALADNKRRQGWADYTKVANALGAVLHNRGLKSFSDKGAEDLKATKAAIVQLYSNPILPNGQANPSYNAEWSKDYNSFDPLKYERLIPGMTELANSDLAKQPNRSDLRVLKDYLSYRAVFTTILAQRKQTGGSGTITAKANADVLNAWQHIVDSLVESNTNFGDLHSRYLSRDLGYTEETEAS